jgi:hypothetical protein
MSATYVLMFCRFTVIVMFVLSVSGKVKNIDAFQKSIEDFQLLPLAWSKVVAWAFLCMEAITILLTVIGGSALLVGFLLSACLLVVFSAALTLVLRRRVRISCNCFGWTERRISPYDVVRNALFILCSLVGLWALASPIQGLSGAEVVLIGFMAVCFVVIVTNLADVVETLRQPFHVR